MKLCYTLVLVFVEALIAFTFFRVCYVRNKNYSLSQKIIGMLSAAFVTVFPNIFIPYASSEILATILFSWYFCFIDILLFSVLYFGVEYSFPKAVGGRPWFTAFYVFFRYDVKAFFHKEKQRTTWFEKLMLILFLFIIADIVCMVSNFFTHSVFVAESFYYNGTFFSSDTYYRIVPYFPYEVHLSISYIMVLLTFVCLIHKSFVVPSFYKVKYVGVIALILFVVLLNSFYVMFELPVDYSVVFYGLISVLIYSFAFAYIPNYLRRETINRVIETMQNGIVIFDNEDNCILVNDYIRKVYNIKPNQNLGEFFKPILQQFSEGKPLAQCEEREETIHTEVVGKEAYYRMSFARIEDKHKKYMGSYFLLMDTTEENLREKQEHYRNTHDSLTGVYNKEYFYDMVSKMLEENPEEKYYILCSDIGNFKFINEVYGVATGDKILKLIAYNLNDRCIPGEVYGRIDNDRFAMLIPKDRLDLRIFIDAMDKIFKSSLDLAVMPICYFGIYEIEDPDMRVSFMCDRAFIAIDTIKGQYGKQVAWYDGTLRDSVLREQELVYQLSEAIATNQIKIYLQPQSSHDGKALGAESLVRWEHPDEGLVSPAEFIPIFEKNGMITKIDRHVWHLVFQKLYEWKQAGHDDLYISVNISPKDFYLMNIYQEFNDLLHEYEINPKNLHIEITEAVMMMDLDRQIKLIDELRSLGFTIEFGDFGVGYSSLKILRECNIEILKLDINFLEKTNSPRNAHIIMKKVITMAQDLGIKVLAKGIESKDQMDLMYADGCTLFQGYYFSKPLDTNMFEKIYL